MNSKNETSLLIECTNNLMMRVNKINLEAIKNEVQKIHFGRGFWTTLPRRLHFTMLYQPTIPGKALCGRLNK